MKSSPIVFFILLAGASFICCTGNEPALTAANFPVPDSVKPYCIISSFNEESVSGVSLLALGNNSHPDPRRITYFSNGEIVIDPLKALSDGRFETLDGK